MVVERESLNTSSNLDNAKALLKSLVPRAQCFCFYDRQRAPVWSSDGVDDHEIDRFIAELDDDAFATPVAKVSSDRSNPGAPC